MANSLTHAAIPFPIYGNLYSVVLPFYDAVTGLPVDPTASDTEYSTDGGATFTDCTNEITTGGGNGVGYLTLTATEMAGYAIVVASKSSNARTSIAIINPRIMIALGTLTVSSSLSTSQFTLVASDLELVFNGNYHPEGLWISSLSGTGLFQARPISFYNGTNAITVTPPLETQFASDTIIQFGFPSGVGAIRQNASIFGGFVR